jgi:hypothetical protein
LRSLDRFSGAETKRKEDSGNTSLASPAAPRAKDRVLRTLPATPASPPPDRQSAANGNAVAEITPSARPAVSAPRDEKQNRNELDSASAGVPPAPQAQARVATGAREIAGASGQSAESVTATGEAPPTLAAQPRPNDRVEPPSASNQPAAGQAANVQPTIGRTFQALAKAAVPPGSEIVVRASGTMLWRAGRQGSIERSSDSGVTWTVQVSPSHEDWLAGSAAADTVCWLAGRNGAIARTADGQHWEKIAPPPASASASGTFPDWIGVAARNAETATLTASDRRQYATEDGGKTWQAQ